VIARSNGVIESQILKSDHSEKSGRSFGDNDDNLV
jgi:hypothetical protein